MTHEIARKIGLIIIAISADYGLETEAFGLDDHFDSGIGMDGCDLAELIHRCEEQFGVLIPDDAVELSSRLNDLVKIIADLIVEKEAREKYRNAAAKAWIDFPED